MAVDDMLMFGQLKKDIVLPTGGELTPVDDIGDIGCEVLPEGETPL